PPLLITALLLLLPSSLSSPLFSFFFQRYVDPRDLHSFPTRRSSDLPRRHLRVALVDLGNEFGDEAEPRPIRAGELHEIAVGKARSEEHTSELQSRENLVCRLLLEKKKQKHAQTGANNAQESANNR